jgi:hypothetical protein
VLVVLLGILFGCGGGSGGDAGNIAPPVIEDELSDGIWSGLFTSIVDSTASGVIGAVSVQNEAQFVAAAVFERHYAGALATAGDVLIGSLSIYRGKDGPFFGAGGLDSIDIDGTTISRARLSGEFAGDDEGQFGLNYDSVYEAGSSLATTAGIWEYSEPSAAGPLYTVTLDIDAAGAIFGTDSAGCTYSGQVALVDGSFNVYDVSFEISACPAANGDYNGLGWIRSVGGGTQNRLTVGLTRNDLAFAATFIRL